MTELSAGAGKLFHCRRLGSAFVGVPNLHASQLAHQHTPPSGLMTNGEEPQRTS